MNGRGDWGYRKRGEGHKREGKGGRGGGGGKEGENGKCFKPIVSKFAGLIRHKTL